MKKVLIISYFFPPSNFVGGDRPASWVKHLHQYGYYPIIITRQWNEGQKELTDKVIDNRLTVEQKDTYEVHRLPYKRSLRDRCAGKKWLMPVQKFLTLTELILSNFSLRCLPYSNFYKYAKSLLQKDSDIQFLLVSGRPFQSFFIGHQLKKDFPTVHWIPDYRDQWTTYPNLHNRPLSQRLMHKLDNLSEKRWTKNASFFLSVSDFWVKKIAEFIKIKGSTVKNGFSQNFTGIPSASNSDKLTIGFVGTLYNDQNIELLIEVIDTNFSSSVEVVFIGIEMNPDQLMRVKQLKKHFIKILPRVHKDKLHELVASIDVFYLARFYGVKGWYPVKLFDYYKWGKAILLFPSDEDVMEEFIIETKSGFYANNKDDCKRLIGDLLGKKQDRLPLVQKRNTDLGEKYTREYQTKVLAEILGGINDN